MVDYIRPTVSKIRSHIYTQILAQPTLALYTQCFKTDLYAHAITAVLLIVACKDEHLDFFLPKLNDEAPI